MDDPALTKRVAKRLRAEHPALPIIARARDTDHAAALYRAGVTDAVPEALEASLQLSEAVLVDIGVAMGPVIASIHEKRSELRAQIMEAGQLEVEPSLGRRRAEGLRPTRWGERQGSRSIGLMFRVVRDVAARRKPPPRGNRTARCRSRQATLTPSLMAEFERRL